MVSVTERWDLVKHTQIARVWWRLPWIPSSVSRSVKRLGLLKNYDNINFPGLLIATMKIQNQVEPLYFPKNIHTYIYISTAVWIMKIVWLQIGGFLAHNAIWNPT